MKTYKKILFGLSLLLAMSAVAFLGVSILEEPQAEAQPNLCNYAACSETDIDLSITTYKIINQSIITAHFGPSGGGQDVIFRDLYTPDDEHEFLAPVGTFCGGEKGQGGVDISDAEWARLLSGAATIRGTVDVDWFN